LQSCAASGGTANLDLATGIVAHADFHNAAVTMLLEHFSAL